MGRKVQKKDEQKRIQPGAQRRCGGADRPRSLRAWTSRSNLINQVLAEYVSLITPEKRRKDIFDSLVSVLGGFEPFQVQAQGSDSMLSIRSPLRIKYNPTIKYTVELSLHSKSELGQLKIMTRTQSQTLIELLDAFFYRFSQIEQRYIRGLFPEVTPHYQVGQGRFIRNFSLLKEGSKNSEIGTAIAAYIQMIDRALKGCLGADSGSGTASSKKFI